MMRRDFLSLSEAVRTVIGALGIEATATIAGRSQSAVYKWADPNLKHFPNLKQALDMDVAFVQGAHGPPPFMTAYMALFRYRLEGRSRPISDVIPCALEIVNLACAVLQEAAAQKTASLSDEAAAQPLNCSICVNLRKLGEAEASLSWTMSHDLGPKICPLRRYPNANVDCKLAIGAPFTA